MTERGLWQNKYIIIHAHHLLVQNVGACSIHSHIQTQVVADVIITGHPKALKPSYRWAIQYFLSPQLDSENHETLKKYCLV